jgi:hypothetical protein
MGVSMLLSHTSGGHGSELKISPCEGWATLWRGSHHMIMDTIAFSSTTHAVIPLVGVVTLNRLLKGFRQGAPSLCLEVGSPVGIALRLSRKSKESSL